MGEYRWYLTWGLAGVLAICVFMLVTRFSVLKERAELSGDVALPPARTGSTLALSGSSLAAEAAPGRDAAHSANTPRDKADTNEEAATAGTEQERKPERGGYTWTADGAKRGAAPDAAAARKVQGKLNINTATLSELVSLPGIGPKLAQSIIDYRKTHGAFKRVEDLDNVKGIGPAKLADIKPLVTVKTPGS